MTAPLRQVLQTVLRAVERGDGGSPPPPPPPEYGDPTLGIVVDPVTFSIAGSSNPFGAGVWRDSGGSMMLNVIATKQTWDHTFDPEVGVSSLVVRTTIDTGPNAFNPHWTANGEHVYFFQNSFDAAGTVYMFTCSVAGDFTTRGSIIQGPNITGVLQNMGACHISTDGSLFICGTSSGVDSKLYVFTMATPFDIPNMVFDYSTQVEDNGGYFRDIDFTADGLVMFSATQFTSGAPFTNDDYAIYQLTSPYDLTTMTRIYVEPWTSISGGNITNVVSISVDESRKTAYFNTRTTTKVGQLTWEGFPPPPPPPFQSPIDVSTLNSQVTQSFAAQNSAHLDLAFSPDGLVMFTLGNTAREINAYDCSIPFDFTSAVVNGGPLGLSDSSVTGLSVTLDGLHLYYCGVGSDAVYHYDMDSWDLSTATNVTSKSVAAHGNNPNGMGVTDDGLKCYVSSGLIIYEWDMSTPHDLSTMVFNQSISLAARTGLYIYPDRTGFMEYSGGVFKAYDMTDGDISTYVLNSTSPAIAGMTGSSVSNDGLYVYAVTGYGVDLHRFDTFQAPPFFDGDLSGIHDKVTTNFSIDNSQIRDIQLSPDGLKMFLLGRTGDLMMSYELSVAWDLSTATLTSQFSYGGLESSGTALWVHPDGEIVFLVGTGGDAIDRITMSTAWDLGTAAGESVFAFGVGGLNPTCLAWAGDGMSFYTCATTFVRQYSVSSAFTLTGASFVAQFSIGPVVPNGLFMYPDGTGYIVMREASMTPYTMTAGDITTSVIGTVETVTAGGGAWMSSNTEYIYAVTQSVSGDAHRWTV